MKIRFLLTSLLLTTAVTIAQTPVMSPPERRIYVTSTGVLEWQPGLGIVVLSGSATTQVTQRRISRADGKSIVQTERSAHIERPYAVKRPLDLRKPRIKQQIRDEGESLMEEIEPLD